LARKGTELEVLRSGALAGMTSRQALLNQRRSQAVDELWSGVVALAPAKAVSQTMLPIKFEVAAQRAATDAKVKEMFQMLGQSVPLERGLNTGESDKASIEQAAEIIRQADQLVAKVEQARAHGREPA